MCRCLEIWEPQPPGTLRACPGRLQGLLYLLLVFICIYTHTNEPGYNDISLYDTSPITSGILWYHYNDISLYDTSLITSGILWYHYNDIVLYDTSPITSGILWYHYNDIGLCDTSPITSGILRYQLIPHC